MSDSEKNSIALITLSKGFRGLSVLSLFLSGLAILAFVVNPEHPSFLFIYVVESFMAALFLQSTSAILMSIDTMVKCLEKIAARQSSHP